MANAPTPVEIFCCYSQADERWLRRLGVHLGLLKQQGLISLWHDRLIAPGANQTQIIDQHLETASIILLLVSADLLASNYSYGVEMKRAVERSMAGEARVIPILVRPVDWQEAPFAHLQALPTGGKPITMWRNQDEAFADVAVGIRQAIKDLDHIDTSRSSTPVRATRAISHTLAQQQRARIVQMLGKEYDKRLAQSLQGATMMVLGLHERTDMIHSSAQLVFHRTTIAPVSVLPSGTSIIQVYDDARQGLLILGAPGAGKTTLLLNLAQELLIRAQSDPTYPIAVILNLASWAAKKSLLDSWIIDQLCLVYGVPFHLSQTLLEQDQWLLLLDGLDEVEASARSACVEAINGYRRKHFVSLVVCSRYDEYVTLETQLTLSTAAEVQPLQEQEVTEYLKRGGKPMAAIGFALQDNPVLKELLTNPLMLNVVILAYRDKAVEDLPNLGSVEEQQREIFTCYVERMLEQRVSKKDFTPQQARQWLTWLAQQLQVRHLTEFYLEELQLTWLPRRAQIVFYVLAGLLFGLLAGLFVGIEASLAGGLLPRLLVGSFAGLMVGGGVFTIGVEREEQNRRIKKIFNWSWKKSASLGLVGGLFSGLLIGLVSGLVGALVGALVGGMFVALFFGPSSKQISESMSLHPHQRIQSEGLEGLYVVLRIGLFFGLFLGGTGALVGVINGSIHFGLAKGILAMPFFVLLFGMLFGILGALVGGLAGGTIYLQHYGLRFLLWRRGAMPWYYVRFLEEAHERVLLQRFGGGYRFIHPLLQEYFASLGAEEPVV